MIRGEKIQLRTVRETDLDALFSLISDLSNRGAFLTRELPSESGFHHQFREHGFWGPDEGFLLICADGRIVGRIGYSRTMAYFNGLELWYAIFDPADRNQGYTTEAITLMVKYLFSTRSINRLQIATDAGNAASKHVAQKCGFQYEGTARKAVYHCGEHRDQDIYSILRDEVSYS